MLLFLGYYISISQTPPSHELKTFQSEDGKLFWPKKIPAYIFIGTTENPANAKKLQSENNKEYSNPLYFDTEGVNYIRSYWATDKNSNVITPKIEIKFEVYADVIASNTKINIISENKLISNKNTYYAVDNVGNASQVKTEDIYIDNTAPISDNNLENTSMVKIVSNNSIIKLISKDEGGIGISNIYYSLDSINYRIYTNLI